MLKKIKIKKRRKLNFKQMKYRGKIFMNNEMSRYSGSFLPMYYTAGWVGIHVCNGIDFQGRQFESISKV